MSSMLQSQASCASYAAPSRLEQSQALTEAPARGRLDVATLLWMRSRPLMRVAPHFTADEPLEAREAVRTLQKQTVELGKAARSAQAEVRAAQRDDEHAERQAEAREAAEAEERGRQAAARREAAAAVAAEKKAKVDAEKAAFAEKVAAKRRASVVDAIE